MFTFQWDCKVEHKLKIKMLYQDTFLSNIYFMKYLQHTQTVLISKLDTEEDVNN